MGIPFSTKKRGNLIALVDIQLGEPRPESTAEDADLNELCTKVMYHAYRNLQRLQSYKGSSDKIRRAITNPSADVEAEAWQAIRPTIYFLKDCYDTARMIEDLLPHMIWKLIEPSPNEAFGRSAALLRMLADMFSYIFIFDECKLTNPEIQNDFSYYRRTLNRIKLNKGKVSDTIVPDDIANQMSLFFAHPNPLFSSVLVKLRNPEYRSGSLARLRKSLGSAISGHLYMSSPATRRGFRRSPKILCIEEGGNVEHVVDEIHDYQMPKPVSRTRKKMHSKGSDDESAESDASTHSVPEAFAIKKFSDKTRRASLPTSVDDQAFALICRDIDFFIRKTKHSDAHKLSIPNILDCISLLTVACHDLVLHNSSLDKETMNFAFQVITIAVLFYDHLSIDGAADKSCPFNIKYLIRTIRFKMPDCYDRYLNLIKYNSRTLGTDYGSKTVRKLLQSSQHSVA